MDADWRPRIAFDWLLFLLYGAAIFCLLPIRPLWLDELMEVVGSAGLPLREVVSGYAAHSAGQSPLAACEQAIAMKLFGFSLFAVRLPAAISALLAVAGMLVLGRRLRFEHSWLPFACLAILPVVLRYAAEDRPYSQVLCIAVWLSVVFIALSSQGGVRAHSAYTALLILGLYTQPYILFLSASHGAYLILRKQWAAALRLAAIAVAAGCLYLPWYLHAHGFWRQEVNTSLLHFQFQPKLILLIARELSGAGYIGTAALIALACLGLARTRRTERDSLLFVFSFLLPMVLVVIADWMFDYFFAIRQVIFVLPALAVMAAAGFEQLVLGRGARIAATAGVILLTINTGYAVRWFTKPGEDWSAAARTLHDYTKSGACFIPLPAGSGAYYTFFDPILAGYECKSLDAKHPVALAVSPYLLNAATEADARHRLQAAGFVLQHRDNKQPAIELYVRDRTTK